LPARNPPEGTMIPSVPSPLPSRFEPRPYQIEAKTAVLTEIASGNTRTVVVLPRHRQDRHHPQTFQRRAVRISPSRPGHLRLKPNEEGRAAGTERD
jgi:hypothetical protein